MANIKEAFQYASQNPNSDFARNLSQLASSGALDQEAQKNGIDLTPFKPKPVDISTQPRESLTEQQRAQRDLGNAAGVVGGKEIAQGIGQAIAQPQNAQALGQAQNQATDIQTQLLQRIKQGKEAGADTKRLEDALKVITENIGTIGNETGQILNPNNLTNEQVLGSGLQLATTAAGGKVAGGITNAVGTGTGVLAGAGRGALAGAGSGAVVGALEGTAGAMKNNKSASDVGKSALLSGIGGAVAGGAIGAVSGGIAGKVKANKIAKENFVNDLVSPQLNANQKELAIKQGRVTEPGIFNPSRVEASKRDKELADAVKDVVSNKKTTLQNANAISNKVSEINDGVKAYVQENKTPFNTNQLKSKLNGGKDELKLIFASDTNAENTYNAVVDEFMKNVQNKDTAGLMDARQNFDKIPAIKKLLDSQGLGENVKKEVALTVRRKANEYIAELLPKGNEYRSQLLRESKMLEALGNIAEKNKDIIGQNKIQMFTKKNPIIKWLVGLGIAGGVGAGGAVIGSLD